MAGRRFDLVVSNPPFVVGPGTTTHVYRDSGRVGDAIGAELAAAAPGLLTEGGTMQYLANWVHVAGEEWDERVAGWFAGTGLDAWVIQREVADPMAYVDLWLTDVGETADPQRMAAWLDWFDAHKVEGIGFGIVSLRRGGHADPVVRVEDLRQRVQPPLGDQVAAWFDRQDFLRVRDTEALLAERYRAAEGLQLRQEATMGEEGWGWTGRSSRCRTACAGPRRSTRWCWRWSVAPTAGCRCVTSSPCSPPRTTSSPTRWPRPPARSWRTWWSAGSSSR